MKLAPVSADLLIKLALAAGAVLAVVYAVRQVKGAAGAVFGDIGNTVGTWASDAASMADKTVSNVIVGAGGLVGIPATNDDQCSLDIARGDTWAASFSCPAPRFLKEAVLNPPKNVGATGTW